VRRSMIALWVRALAYLVVVGGSWLVALPACILIAETGDVVPAFRSLPAFVLGIATFAIGFVLACWAGYCLIQYGQGTPLPLDPPRRLVVCGPYRWVRNPQGIGMMLMVFGEVIAVRSRLLWCLLAATLVYLEMLVGRWEERQMARDFGSEYTAYVGRTRKWLPRRGPGTSSFEHNG
jgi:protein-S-isoprenylcysteine O-methyltransferase Ste14